MNSFAIPGHVTLGDFVERAGKVMLKDEWLGTAAVAAEPAHRQEFLDLVRMSRSRPYGRPAPSQHEIAIKASAWREERQCLRAQYEQVIVRVRTALCMGEISAGRLELLTGHIVAIPAEFWRSPLAEAVFVNETPWLVPEPDRIGQVLLTRSEAEAWFAGLAPSEEMSTPKLRPTETNVKTWVAQRLDSGVRRGKHAMWDDFKGAFEKGFGRDRFRELRDEMMKERGMVLDDGRPPRA